MCQLPPFNRRKFFKASGLGGLGSLMIPTPVLRPEISSGRTPSHRSFEVVSVQRNTVRVPYREVPGRHMARELPHWKYSEIFQVRLKSGQIGVGETLLYYTWGVSDADDVGRVQGSNAVELMWDDTLGAGLQMALFDAVGRTASVPVHALLGHQVYKSTPLSWWNIDTTAQDMASECREALRLGYRAYKTKGRPWFDVWKQIELAAAEVPESFKIDMDFNDTLLDAHHAIPVLQDLEKYPQIGIYETPIPQQDIVGNQAIRKATRVPIAMHFGRPKPLIALKEDVCDGFVIGGGASRVMENGAIAAMAQKPFWLQLVGTGITAAFSLHFGAVLSHAIWPAVNCHQLYTHNMLTEPIIVNNGFVKIPNKAGLGYELDRGALEKFRISKPTQRPDPPRLIETSWPDGRRMYCANSGEVNFMISRASQGRMPFFERGVTTRMLPNDGSSSWQQLYKKSQNGPFLMTG